MTLLLYHPIRIKANPYSTQAFRKLIDYFFSVSPPLFPGSENGPAGMLRADELNVWTKGSASLLWLLGEGDMFDLLFHS